MRDTLEVVQRYLLVLFHPTIYMHRGTHERLSLGSKSDCFQKSYHRMNFMLRFVAGPERYRIEAFAECRTLVECRTLNF